MSRSFLLVGPALVLCSCALAFAQDASGASSVATPSTFGADFLLSMGPYGALVWGAYLLGRGVKVTVQVELSDTDRELIGKLGRGASP